MMILVKYATRGQADDLIRPQQWWDDADYSGATRSITIHENLDDATPTGVLDANGVMIVRLRERVAFGFVRD